MRTREKMRSTGGDKPQRLGLFGTEGEKDGDFIVLQKDTVRDEDFPGNTCRLPFYIAADKLHGGRNYGSIRLSNPYASLTAKVTVVGKTVLVKAPGIRRQKSIRL